MPSMPMLMMPVRSQRMPQRAPRINGTLARRVKLSALTPKKMRSQTFSPRAVVSTRIDMMTKTARMPPMTYDVIR